MIPIEIANNCYCEIESVNALDASMIQVFLRTGNIQCSLWMKLRDAQQLYLALGSAISEVAESGWVQRAIDESVEPEEGQDE